jgi:bifunctional DNase/RNase
MDRLEIKIHGLYMDPSDGSATVLLGGIEDVERVLPIMIGPAEARAIAIGVEHVPMPRPGTHDLLLASLDACRARLVGVDIVGLSQGTFLAELRIETENGIERVDARPSDGIALAVRAEVPVAVDRDVFDEAGIAVIHEPGEPFAEEQVEQIISEFQDFLETARPSDFESSPSTESDDDSEPDGTRDGTGRDGTGEDE